MESTASASPPRDGAAAVGGEAGALPWIIYEEEYWSSAAMS